MSVGLNGEYGLNNIFISVPTIINKNGAKEIVEIKLAEDEKALLQKSADVVQGLYKELQI